MKSWLVRQLGGVSESRVKAVVGRAAQTAYRAGEVSVKARYDAAQDNPDLRRHWAGSDALSAKNANRFAVRKRLRERARYEVANNSYAKGIVITVANDTIGTGPRLQILGPDRVSSGRIESLFAKWAQTIRLAEKLRICREAKMTDGEVIAKLFTNRGLKNPVQLDIEVIEIDRLDGTADLDPITYDASGNPVRYDIWKTHPGDLMMAAPTDNVEKLSAEFVIHLFRVDRPGQTRGIPEITPALPLFAKLRQYTGSVLGSANIASKFSAVLETQQTPAEVEESEPFDTLEIEDGMLITMPAGYALKQMRPEQPSTGYDTFKAEIIKEIARCIGVPFNVAAGDSSGYNYSSGRLDYLIYRTGLSIERDDLTGKFLDRVFDAWFLEAAMLPGYLPPIARESLPVEHRWIWPAFEAIDPIKDATANVMLLSKGLKTQQDYWAENGQDWEEARDQIAIEVAGDAARGLPCILTPDPMQMAEAEADAGAEVGSEGDDNPPPADNNKAAKGALNRV